MADGLHETGQDRVVCSMGIHETELAVKTAAMLKNGVGYLA